jgi:hypothetical protein
MAVRPRNIAYTAFRSVSALFGAAFDGGLQTLNLVGNFRFRLAHGKVGVLGWIWGFLDRKRLGVGGTAEFVFGEMTVGIHSILMREASQRKPSIFLFWGRMKGGKKRAQRGPAKNIRRSNCSPQTRGRRF